MRGLLHLFLVGWLAAAFGLGQQAAALHALGHAVEEAGERQDSAPAPEKCPDHSLFTSFAAALGVDAYAPAIAPTGATRPAPQHVGAPPAPPRLAFLSRAPPRAS